MLLYVPVLALTVLFTVNGQSIGNTTSGDPRNYKSRPCTDENHIFTAPGVLTAGASNRACLSRFYTEGRLLLTLTLITADQQTVSVVRELPPGDGGCVDIAAPELTNTKAELVVNVKYPDVPCSWERRSVLRVSSGRVLLLQTEKQRYRPGETLKFRVLALRADLTPGHAPIDEVWLESPQGAWSERTRVTHWQRTRTRLGIAQLQHRLDARAPHGKWTARAALADGTQGSADFWVGDYELPPFHLSVRHSPQVLRSSERLVWNVCVRYPWSEAVEGMLMIRLRGAGGRGASVRTAVRLRAPRACHRHAVAARRVGLDGPMPPDVVIADFSFEEDGTRIWQNTTVVSQVVDKAVTLEILSKHRTVIAPGLPYKLKIKATRWDNKPAANERVRICRSPSEHASEQLRASSASREDLKVAQSCDDSMTDSRGLARVMFTTGADEQFAFYRFEVTLHNDSTIASAPLYLPVKRTGISHAAFGPLSGDTRAPGSRVFVPLYLNLRNVLKAITVHFVVITRGGVIYRWGATTQCPIANSATRARSASRDTDCFYFDSRYPSNRSTYPADRHGYPADRGSYPTNREHSAGTQRYKRDDGVDDRSFGDRTRISDDKSSDKAETVPRKPDLDNLSSNELLDRHLLRVMLPIRVTQQMCPDSHLVAYFYYNGELVSAIKHFEVEECFANKAELSWLTRQTAPGSTASLRITTAGPSICALSATDVATKWLQPAAPSAKDSLVGLLRKLLGGNRNATTFDVTGECFMSEDHPQLPTSNMELTATFLAAAGVRLVGGDLLIQTRCEATAPEPMTSLDEPAVPRTDFSEAWLWKLVGVSPNGTATVTAKTPDSITRHEATAICVARNGIAVSPPATLQVFQEFFIHADGPKRLRRGDTTFLRYRIFNYLYEPLAIQIQILTDPHLELLTAPTESACVQPRVSIAQRAEIRAKIAGNGRISIRGRAEWDGRCGNETAKGNGSRIGDEVIINVVIDHEGVPKREYRSMLLCGQGSTESSASDVTWTWPAANAVPGSESLTLWALGDISGPLLTDADALITLPQGCGEQNMARLATNLLALNRLDPRNPAAAEAKDHVARGFARQMQFMHASGGFSAFGSTDGVPSTWLTAFTIRYLRRAHKILSPVLPPPSALERSERWLLGQQMENGCFRNEGQVFHRELKGGLGEDGELSNVALTAYVVTSLIEGGLTVPSRVLRNSLACLRALPPLKSKAPARIYGHALLAYTFMRLKKHEEDLRRTNDATLLRDKTVSPPSGAGLHQDEDMRELVALLKMARRSEEFVWWETGNLATSIEATSYALMALAACPAELRESSCAHDARGAIRWLSTHRSGSGGFLSTQDTLVALEALTAWSSTQPGAPARLNVTALCAGAAPQTRKLPTLISMKSCDKLSVGVSGTGCALVQATRAYNDPAPQGVSQDLLTVQVSVHTDGPFDCDVNSTFCFCAAVVEACVIWTGSFPEMALLEVTLPGGFGVEPSMLYAQLQHPNTLLRRIEMSPNGGRATLYLGSRDGSDVSTGNGGHQCFSLHAVGPRARTKPAYARIMDYYRPEVNDTQIYAIPEDCPPRIADSNKAGYSGFDNLFGSARSLDGGLLISDEFSSEDMQDVIPLEDPLYDNLTDANDGANASVRDANDAANAGVTDANDGANAGVRDANDAANAGVRDANDGANASVRGADDGANASVRDANDGANASVRDANDGANASVRDAEDGVEATTKQVQLNNSEETQVASEDFQAKNETANSKEIIEDENEVVLREKETFDVKEVQNNDNEIPNDSFKSVFGNENGPVENAKLQDFHVIDSETDLEVPSGVEGPVPIAVLPPLNFVVAPPPQGFAYRASDRANVKASQSRPYVYDHPIPRHFPTG